MIRRTLLLWLYTCGDDTPVEEVLMWWENLQLGHLWMTEEHQQPERLRDPNREPEVMI